jgi:hypothetical protein
MTQGQWQNNYERYPKPHFSQGLGKCFGLMEAATYWQAKEA